MTMPIPAEIKKSFSAARILGNGDDRVTLSENEFFCRLSSAVTISGLLPKSRNCLRFHLRRRAMIITIPLAWFKL